MGSVISPKAAEQLLAAQANLLSLGARSLLEMKQLKPNTGLLSPGIVDGTGAELPDEEYFGPLLTVYRYKSFDDALALANQTRFGLSAGLLSDDRKLFDRLVEEVRAGVVNWNRPLTRRQQRRAFRRSGGQRQPSSQRLLRGGLLRLAHGLPGSTQERGARIPGAGAEL